MTDGAIQQRHLQVDVLRGVAALAVTYFHLSGSAGLHDTTLVRSGSLGWLGVEIFFAISGFVIPHSLWRGRYEVGAFPRFFGKRLVRIDPPYLASIALGIAVGFVGMGANFEWPTLTQLLMHLGYLTVFTGEWFNPVYWTLAIELQYYAFVGIAYPFLAHRMNWVAIASLVFLCSLALVLPGEGFLPHWAGIFSMGVLVFRRMNKLIGRWTFAVCICCFAVETGFTAGWLEAVAGLMAALFILFVRIRSAGGWIAPFVLLGVISYSLYLVHWDIGRAIVSASRHVPLFGQLELVRLVVGLFASLVAAYVFYRLVEKPSLVLSKWISYKPGDRSLPRDVRS
jgi:peptidoglycan/LPS O-acetylase OafA/YrhL